MLKKEDNLVKKNVHSVKKHLQSPVKKHLQSPYSYYLKSNRAGVLKLIKKGVSIPNIATLRNSTIRAVYYLIKNMKKDGLLTDDLELTDKGMKVLQFSMGRANHLHKKEVPLHQRSNIIRLHNVHVTVRILNKTKDYDYRNNNLISLKVRDYKIVDLKGFHKEQFVINDVEVRTNPNSIEIFPSEMYSETKQEATRRLMKVIFDTIKKVENLYHILLIKENYLNIRISKQHYALIHNELAKLYKTEYKGSTFRVFDEQDGKVRLVIDFSGTPEFEATHPLKSPEDIEKAQTFFKDLINKESLLLSDISNSIKKITELHKRTEELHFETASGLRAVVDVIKPKPEERPKSLKKHRPEYIG